MPKVTQMRDSYMFDVKAYGDETAHREAVDA